MNILTFDLEDWFHILDVDSLASPLTWDKQESRIEKNTERILELLERNKIRATWFCLGWVARKYPSLVRQIAGKHDIGCHSMLHELLFRQGEKAASSDLKTCVRTIEDVTGKKVKSYRAPGFSFTRQTPWLISLLAGEGIEIDSSVFPAKRNHGGFASFPVSSPCRISWQGHIIKEFPMNTAKPLGFPLVFSGGGYFRFFPEFLIHQWMNNSPYVMTYFHPRDFDPTQPVPDGLPVARKFMSFTGLKKSFGRLERLLNDFTFIALDEAAQKVSWDETPVIRLEEYQ